MAGYKCFRNWGLIKHNIYHDVKFLPAILEDLGFYFKECNASHISDYKISIQSLTYTLANIR